MNLEYIIDHFMSLTALSLETGVETAEIESFIADGLLPDASYRVSLTGEVHSFLGEAKDDGIAMRFFSKSHVGRIRHLKSELRTTSIEDLKKSLRGKFDQAYRARLDPAILTCEGFTVFKDQAGASDEGRLQAYLDEEWQHYLKGTYGLCTKTAAFDEIAIKEVSSRIIAHYLEHYGAGLNDQLSAKDRQYLLSVVDDFDKVCSKFAPFERAHCSRTRYIHTVREALNGKPAS